MKIWFEKDVYMPGETAKIIGEFNNSECDMPIQNIECELINRITFRSDNGKIYERVKNVTKINIPGIGAKETALASEGKAKYT